MKKIFSTFLLLITMFTVFIMPVYAEDEEDSGTIERLPVQQGWEEMDEASNVVQDTPEGGQNAEKTAGKSMYGTASVLLTAIAPEVVADPEDLPETMRRGILGVTEDGIMTLFNNQPRIDVVAHLAEEWVPGYKESNAVYASGYDDLTASGIATLWSTTRNVAYAFYVVIMIIIGFMIMFRNKIGGQMMVTVGNSLPKVIVSLVLVTFSFAIMGLIIDVAGIAQNILTAIFYGDEIAKSVQVTNPWALFASVFTKSATAQWATGTTTGLGIVGIVADLATGGPGVWLFAGIALLLVALIISGIILVGAIKLWIALIKAYLGLLINVITAPLAIMVSAIPGNDAAMTNTFKSALRNALVFPLAYGIVNLPYYIADRGVSLTFPSTLTGEAQAGNTFLSNMLIGIAKIVAVYAAASAPDIAKSIIPATAPKSGIDLSKSLKEGMGKVPFIGGMFK